MPTGQFDITVTIFDTDYELVSWLMKHLGVRTRSEAINMALRAFESEMIPLEKALTAQRSEDAAEGP